LYDVDVGAERAVCVIGRFIGSQLPTTVRKWRGIF